MVFQVQTRTSRFLRPDVILAFWGYNESFDNSPDAYRADLAKWVDETEGKKYNGKGAPRIVLLSPSPMKTLAKLICRTAQPITSVWPNILMLRARLPMRRADFVDLFTLSQELYEKNKSR